MKAWSRDTMEISFSQDWLYKRLGVTCEEKEWFDPIYRTEKKRDIERAMYDLFKDVGLGSRDPVPQPDMEAYGHRFFPALYGCEIRFIINQAPCVIPLSLDNMRDLKPVDLELSPVYRRYMEEARILTNHYGFCGGGINTGSPLNAACTILEEDFLCACAADPEGARYALRTFGQTMLDMYDRMYAVTDPAHFKKPFYGFYGNCPAVMFSPQMYRDVILPVDLWYRDHFNGFMMHHCGVLNPYAELYMPIRPDAFEIGGGSDLKRARTCFPDCDFILFVNAVDIEGKAPKEIDELIGGMLADAAPFIRIRKFWVTDLSSNTGDDVIRALRTVGERIRIT